jgi:oxygen-independent coproporphyrinogen-3 oxidase
MANEENYSNFEELSILDQFNEEVMLSLRTHWGIDLKFIQMCYGDKLSFELLAKCETYFASKKMFIQDEHLILTSEGRKQADGIASSLFLV